MKQIVIIFLFFLSLSLSAQTQNTYVGNYEFKFPYNTSFGLLHSDNGSARYTYTENSDGSRNFNGKFKFTGKRLSVSGTFNDNRQVGEWLYSVKSNFYIQDKYFIGHFKMTYNFVDGIVTGPVSINIIDDNTGKVMAYCKCTISDNKIIGSISAFPDDAMGTNNSVYTMPYMHKIIGQFDETGSPVGTWSVTSNSHKVVETFSEENAPSVKFINTTTGDIDPNMAYRKPELPNIIVDIINNGAELITFRDSELLKIPHFNF